jgi:hypothetical protein
MDCDLRHILTAKFLKVEQFYIMLRMIFPGIPTHHGLGLIRKENY